MSKKVYLDYAATTPVAKEVLDEMLPYFSDKFGNASSVHFKGQEAKRAFDEARIKIAKLIEADPDEVVFTSGGTESDNLALRGVMEAYREKRKHLIVSKIEHPAVLKTAQALEKKGFKVDYLDVDEGGFVNLEQLSDLITEETVLVSIMYANNEIGMIQPIAEISKLIKEKNKKTFFHTDAAQAFNYLNCDVRNLGVDLMTLSGQKIYGPKGIGILYIKRGIMLESQQTGGEHEFGKRAGTENVSGAVGMAQAMEITDEQRIKENRRLTELRDKLIEGIKKIKGAHLSGSVENRLSNNVNFCFKDVEGEALVMSLDFQGVMVSSGSACSSAKLEPSYVLRAIDTPVELAQGSLRLTLGRSTTEEDIDYTIQTLGEVLERLRTISTM